MQPAFCNLWTKSKYIRGSKKSCVRKKDAPALFFSTVYKISSAMFAHFGCGSGYAVAAIPISGHTSFIWLIRSFAVHKPPSISYKDSCPFGASPRRATIFLSPRFCISSKNIFTVSFVAPMQV